MWVVFGRNLIETKLKQPWNHLGISLEHPCTIPRKSLDRCQVTPWKGSIFKSNTMFKNSDRYNFSFASCFLVKIFYRYSSIYFKGGSYLFPPERFSVKWLKTSTLWKRKFLESSFFRSKTGSKSVQKKKSTKSLILDFKKRQFLKKKR